MDEFKFVLKCLIFSCVIVIFSQTQISGDTLENKAFIFFKHSETAQWVRAAADGGVKLIREGVSKTQSLMSNKYESSSSSSPQQHQQVSRNTGLFRKLEKEKAQQRGDAAELEINNPDFTVEE